jgi:hypothetical protein
MRPTKTFDVDRVARICYVMLPAPRRACGFEREK